MRVLRSSRFTLFLALALLAGIVVAVPTSRVFAHGDEVPNSPKEPPPPDQLVLSDVMRLVGMDFDYLRREGGKVGVDPRAQAQVVEATQNAQRYLRVVNKEWAPDEDFRGYANAAIAAWGAAEAAAQAGDRDALRDTLAPLGATCKDCHDVYDKDE